MKLKTKIILAVIAIFACMLILTNNVQATTLETVETDTNGALTLTTDGDSSVLEATEDVYAELVIGDGENVTLNLGTYSFYSSSSGASAITVEKGGTLTIDGTYTSNTYNHLSKITVEEGGTLIIDNISNYLEEPIYNYGSLELGGDFIYEGEHAIVNYGYLETGGSYFRDTEKSTGYAIYNYGTMVNSGAYLTAKSVSGYGFLINEGTFTETMNELFLYTDLTDDVPMIVNKKGTMTLNALTIGYDPHGDESGSVCGRIAVENQATLSIDDLRVIWSKAQAAVLQSTADATTTIESSKAGNVPDDFEVLIYADVDLEDSDTNIKLSSDVSVLSEKAILVTEELTSGTMFDTATKVLKDIVSSMKVYDITIELNGEKVQPEGKVKIYIPIPDDMDSSKLVVYRIDEDGTKTEYTVTVEGDYATIETDHFSTYVLAEVTSTDDEELDETPKTGVNTNVVQICSAVLLISTIGLAIIKFKR